MGILIFFEKRGNIYKLYVDNQRRPFFLFDTCLYILDIKSSVSLPVLLPVIYSLFSKIYRLIILLAIRSCSMNFR